MLAPAQELTLQVYAYMRAGVAVETALLLHAAMA